MPKKKKVDIKGMKKPKRPERESFEKIVTGYTFEVVGTGSIEGYPKEAFWCVFCGGRGKNFVVIKRNDGNTYKVGGTCLGRVGLVIPLSVKDQTLVKVQAVKEEGKGKPKPQAYDPIQDEIDKLLKDL